MDGELIRGISAGLLIAVLVFTLGWYLLQRMRGRRVRPLAERLVDVMYRLAALTTAIAHSTDSALCRYRRVRSEINEGHRPQYRREAAE